MIKRSDVQWNFFDFVCYHIKQKYCIFFSPKEFCDTRKVCKGRLQPRLRPGPCCRAHDPLVGWWGNTPPQSIPPRSVSISAPEFIVFFCKRPWICCRWNSIFVALTTLLKNDSESVISQCCTLGLFVCNVCFIEHDVPGWLGENALHWRLS